MSFIKFKNNLYTAEATTNYRIIQRRKKKHNVFKGRSKIQLLQKGGNMAEKPKKSAKSEEKREEEGSEEPETPQKDSKDAKEAKEENDDDEHEDFEDEDEY